MILEQCKDLNALVLIGGQSKRMGQDKKHLNLHGIEQWCHLQNLLEKNFAEIFFSVADARQAPGALKKEVLVEDVFKESFGPLTGILSAFKNISDKSFFVMACDLPGFDQEAIDFILHERDQNYLGTFFVDEKERVEPLCGIYEKEIFLSLLNAWSQNIFCPRKILSQLNIKKVFPKKNSWLTNLNSIEDLHAYKKETKTISVFYYASMKEQTNKSFEEIHFCGETPHDLFLLLQEKYKFNYDQNNLRVAINDEMKSFSASLKHGDNLVFIPPVSGG